MEHQQYSLPTTILSPFEAYSVSSTKIFGSASAFDDISGMALRLARVAGFGLKLAVPASNAPPSFVAGVFTPVELIWVTAARWYNCAKVFFVDQGRLRTRVS